MSTSAWVPGPIWQLGMSIEQESSAAVKSKVELLPSIRLVGEVMGQEPYKSARRVFWIMDNCSAHRGQKAANRLRERWPNLILIHTPIHASWLNQVEIYFSIVQRKVLTPNDFSSLQELAASACLSVPL
jgi:DDE superfamily endonuclease